MSLKLYYVLCFLPYISIIIMLLIKEGVYILKRLYLGGIIMKLKKLLLFTGIIAITSSLLIGCNKKGSSTNKEESVGKVSITRPIYIDEKDKSVTILGKVNGKYFNEPTRHFMVYKEGKNGDKSIITGLGNQIDFYNALVKIGAEAGNNMTLENKTTTHVGGDMLKVSVTWNGANKYYDINSIVKDSNNKKIHMRFGGNLKASKKFNTGCIACLDSCPVGIVSNSTYTYGAVETKKEVEFTGNSKILPKDGTLVAVKYELQSPCCH